MKLLRALFLGVLCAASSSLHAQYPSRPVTLVVPYTAGSDVMAKLARDPAWLAGVDRIGGIPAVRSPAESDKFVHEQYLFYERLAERLGLRQ